MITNYEITAINNVLTTDYNSSFESMFKKYLISLDVLSSDVSYAPYTYNRATEYKNSLTQFSGIKYESSFIFTEDLIEHSSNTSTDSNQRLMRLGADYFDISSDQNFKITCSGDGLLQESDVEITLLKYNTLNGTVVLDEGSPVGDNLVFNVGNNANFNAYSLLVFRKDYDLQSQDNLNSEQYSFSIDTYDPLANASFSNEKISIYPNPSNSDIFIKGDSVKSYELINSLGQVVKNSILNETINLQKISVSDLNYGLYFLKLTLSNNTIITKKLIIGKK